MTWGELLGALRARGLVQEERDPQGAAATASVTGVTHDSRAVARGHVFVALRGQHADGQTFAGQAAARGAVMIVSEGAPGPDDRMPWTVVSDARQALAALAVDFFGDPSAAMRVVGITGTNGKTTTAYLVASIFEAAGVRCGLMGTVAYRAGSVVREAARTTPEAPEVQALLREMVAAGCGACAMEVSSHALTLARVDGTHFAAGVFTNLTRDHLDFHEDMEAYFQAKRRLFAMLPPGAPSIVNLDDPRGAGLAATAARPVTFAIVRDADVTPGPLSFSLNGLLFEIRTPRGALQVRSRLVGRPNVFNILAAVATGIALDLPAAAIERGIEAVTGVPGRFEIVSGERDTITVVVDYAHTDDALRNLLETARTLGGGRLITVFGCGGDRDRSKRPLMGTVAGRLSDLVVVTSDNPRGEDPQEIIDDIQRGLAGEAQRAEGCQVLSIVDRAEAIEAAIARARPGDLVLIAGKGHEKYQVVKDRSRPFDDVAVARSALSRRHPSGVA